MCSEATLYALSHDAKLSGKKKHEFSFENQSYTDSAQTNKHTQIGDFHCNLLFIHLLLSTPSHT